MLDGKIAFISGSSRGIGKEMAHCFAEQGAKLYLNARTPNSLDELIDNLKQSYKIQAEPLYFDVTDSSALKQAFMTIHKNDKRLDIAVNNAGILEDALIGMVTFDQIERTYETNVFSALLTSQYASRLMKRNKSGSIVNVSSIIGSNGNAGQAVYGSSKAALIGMTKSLAKELALDNIRVNAVAPGFIDTDMAKSIPNEKYQERLDSIKMGRIGTTRDIANTALFLCSHLSEYVTGQVIGVDGGMLI
ncbi:MAG: SDR family NAD(P)-dependent oxidoreductase [Coxiellaceae bacterium]|nr:SDR family NAD(P)-dependent oxidoreductase [Coxiellaceae bacterium]